MEQLAALAKQVEEARARRESAQEERAETPSSSPVASLDAAPILRPQQEALGIQTPSGSSFFQEESGQGRHDNDARSRSLSNSSMQDVLNIFFPMRVPEEESDSIGKASRRQSLPAVPVNSIFTDDRNSFYNLSFASNIASSEDYESDNDLPFDLHTSHFSDFQDSSSHIGHPMASSSASDSWTSSRASSIANTSASSSARTTPDRFEVRTLPKTTASKTPMTRLASQRTAATIAAPALRSQAARDHGGSISNSSSSLSTDTSTDTSTIDPCTGTRSNSDIDSTQISTRFASASSQATTKSSDNPTWNSELDERLVRAKKHDGNRTGWDKIAAFVSPCVSGSDCKSRWKELKDGNGVVFNTLLSTTSGSKSSEWRASSGRGGKWTDEEDETLRRGIEKHGYGAWAQIALEIGDRNPKQCRERWTSSINPQIKRGPWSLEDDELLISLTMRHGNAWAAFGEYFPTRSPNQIKTRRATLERNATRDKKAKWTPEIFNRVNELVEKVDTMEELLRKLPVQIKGISSLALVAKCPAAAKHLKH